LIAGKCHPGRLAFAHELHYEIGAKIPKGDWAKYDLYD